MKKMLLIVFTCIVWVAVLGTANAQVMSDITGPGSLDLSGTFVYALAVGNDTGPSIVVGDASFVPFGERAGQTVTGLTFQEGTGP